MAKPGVRFVGTGRSLAAVQRTARDQARDAETQEDSHQHGVERGTRNAVRRVFRRKLADLRNVESERPGLVMVTDFSPPTP